MIKRRFFKHEHGDKDAASDSSSSSDSEVEAESTDEEQEEDDVVAEVRQNNAPSSSSSGYESEDSSVHEVDLDSSDVPSNEDDVDRVEKGEDSDENLLFEKRKPGLIDVSRNTRDEKDEIPYDIPSCVLKTKSVFKCKICPRIVCLTEETLMTHLKSKRHARSEKLLSEGRLKLMLNSDGEIEAPFEGEETHQERHASTLAAAQARQNSTELKRKNKGRQRQRKRKQKKAGEDLVSKVKESTKKPSEKRHKK